ncbi:MAG: DUF4301 family protein [Paludibacteraceae bacterium]|nr:DUF4301 family protein [Paludibacteraceae bacterium]MBQ2190672.1 DUF4301 family protein [Paludibacteraceae bacterium]MBQ4018410.1 DUF4301 family protein [Paludibacteraceae bacterium]MBQ5378962.1 DUF4301 family protein [Paludibacteraceae bacterium]
MNSFSQQDLEQLAARGISVEKAEAQLECFRNGFPELDIVAPASTKRGILAPKRAEQDAYIAAWEQYLKEGHKILKFVPASGAASRMFKNLFQYLEDGIETPFIQEFLAHKDQFAFGPQLAGKEGQEAVRYLLYDMHYGDLPKGLLLFHKYRDGARTPALEHLVEGAQYCKGEGEKPTVYLHFTVSHDHLPLFRQHIADNLKKFEDKYDVKYDVTFSEQLPSTDTLAANPDGTPFRTKDGKLLFRPGGHGALIENLNQQDADIVFIKNIDNVVPDRLKKDTIRYKQILAGVLVTEQKRVFEALKDPNLSDEERAKLNRPIRVCGVVKNTGEPGGGPFLVREADGSISCQILESTQISDPELMKQSTHFNPVDLVCAIRDYEGNPFDLPRYVDPQTGFISNKSKDGKELLALELPGLWNGAMSRWNTIFVEVPVSTFNPVKTVNDLLREQHQ